MKRIAFMTFMIGVLLALTGCSGGGGGLVTLPPSTTDLAGLEGIWDYEVQLTGNIKIAGAKHHEEETKIGYFVITRLSILDLLGNTVTWSYDGSTLWLRWNENVSVSTPYGNFNSDRTYTFQIPITPTDTTGNITGDVVGYLTIPIYGEAKENLSATGLLTKRI